MAITIRAVVLLVLLNSARASTTIAAKRDIFHRAARIAHPRIAHHPAAAAASLGVGAGHHRIRNVNPADFGGDPTGVRDSWAALNRSIAVCLNQSALSPNGHFPGARQRLRYVHCRRSTISRFSFALPAHRC